jgi:hypothetical protein
MHYRVAACLPLLRILHRPGEPDASRDPFMDGVGLRMDIAHGCLDGIVPRHVLQRKGVRVLPSFRRKVWLSAWSPASGRVGIFFRTSPSPALQELGAGAADQDVRDGAEMDAISHELQHLVGRQGSIRPVKCSMFGLGCLSCPSLPTVHRPQTM